MTLFAGSSRAGRVFAARCVYLVVWCATVMLAGCATGSLNLARDAFYNGDVRLASETLAEDAGGMSRDRLLYFMEKGAIQHYAGDYQASAETLLKAAALMREQEIISAGQQAASLVTTEWLMDYKGEYAERLWVHTFQMMNFLLLGRPESALVEAKQALAVYDAYPEACNDDYFTRALIAHCFEALDEINGAYIEYKRLAELMGNPGPVARKLCALGSRLGFDDEVAHFRQFLPAPISQTPEAPVGETLIFLSQGRAPVKIPQDIILPKSIRFSFSVYEERGSYSPVPLVSPRAGLTGKSRITTDVGHVLRTSLNQRLAQIMAKETARVAAKEAIANNINDSGAEALVRLVFLLMEVPDTRCWETLPAYFSLVRVPILPGDSPACGETTGMKNPAPIGDFLPSSRPFYHYCSFRN